MLPLADRNFLGEQAQNRLHLGAALREMGEPYVGRQMPREPGTAVSPGGVHRLDLVLTSHHRCVDQEFTVGEIEQCAPLPSLWSTSYQ